MQICSEIYRLENIIETTEKTVRKDSLFVFSIAYVIPPDMRYLSDK